MRAMKERRQLHAIRRAWGGAVGALSRVYEQSPSLWRRLPHPAGRGRWPAATVQTRRTAQSALNRPRSVWRTCPCGHVVCGGGARARPSWGPGPRRPCRRVCGRPLWPRFGGMPTGGSRRDTHVSAGTWAAYWTLAGAKAARPGLSRPYSASQATRAHGTPWALPRLLIFKPNGLCVSPRRSAGMPHALRL